MLRKINSKPLDVDGTARQWYSSEDMDLILWLNDDGQPKGFQLCYDKGQGEKALTYKNDEGYLHTNVDTGDARDGRYKGAPVMLPDGEFSFESVTQRFRYEASALDSELVDYVTAKLLEYPQAE